MALFVAYTLAACGAGDTATRALTVEVTPGVVGVPIQRIVGPADTTIQYRFQARDGFTDLVVTIDGRPAPVAGQVRLDRDRVLRVAAVVAARVTPEHRALAAALRGLLDARDPGPAYARLLCTMQATFQQVGEQRAERLMIEAERMVVTAQDTARLRELQELLPSLRLDPEQLCANLGVPSP